MYYRSDLYPVDKEDDGLICYRFGTSVRLLACKHIAAAICYRITKNLVNSGQGIASAFTDCRAFRAFGVASDMEFKTIF